MTVMSEAGHDEAVRELTAKFERKHCWNITGFILLDHWVCVINFPNNKKID